MLDFLLSRPIPREDPNEAAHHNTDTGKHEKTPH